MNILDQAPLLIVLLPIFFGVLVFSLSSNLATKICIFLLHVAVAILIYMLYRDVSSGKIVKYVFGGWEAPYGIEFLVGQFNIIFLVFLFFTSLATYLFSYNDLDNLIGTNVDTNKFFAIFCFCLAGFAGIILTNDLFNLYVFIEISAIASYALAYNSGHKKGVSSAIDYMILGTFAATMFLFGIGLIYVSTGTLNISDINNKIQLLTDKKLILVGFAIMVISLMMKFALFPFHQWLVKIYERSNNFATIFFSAISTKITIFILLKFGFFVSINGQSIISFFSKPIMYLSLVSIFVGSLCALRSTKLRSILSYSSVSNIGYIILAISIFVTSNYTLVLCLVWAHLIAKILLFMLNSKIEKSEDHHKFNLTQYLAFVAFIVGAFSLIGLPGTIGFIAKVNFLLALIDINLHIFAYLIIISVITLFYFWRHLQKYYTSVITKKNLVYLRLNQVLVMIFLIMLNIFFGLYPEYLFKFLYVKL